MPQEYSFVKERAGSLSTNEANMIDGVRIYYETQRRGAQSALLENSGLFVHVFLQRATFGLAKHVRFNFDGLLQKIFSSKLGMSADALIDDLQESKRLGLCEFIAVVLRIPLPSFTKTTLVITDDDGVVETHEPITVVIDDTYIAETILIDDALHLWYCLLTWLHVFNESANVPLCAYYIINQYPAFVSGPMKEHLAMYMGTLRCKLWTQSVFRPFPRPPGNVEVLPDERPIRYLQWCHGGSLNPPLMQMNTADGFFCFLLIVLRILPSTGLPKLYYQAGCYLKAVHEMSTKISKKSVEHTDLRQAMTQLIGGHKVLFASAFPKRPTKQNVVV